MDRDYRAEERVLNHIMEHIRAMDVERRRFPWTVTLAIFYVVALVFMAVYSEVVWIVWQWLVATWWPDALILIIRQRNGLFMECVIAVLVVGGVWRLIRPKERV